MAELAIASFSQLQLVIARRQLVIGQQTPSFIVLVEQTNIPFYTFLIGLEITELTIASYSQLQLVIASGQLVIKQTPSFIVLFEQTNIPFYTFLIRIEIAELAIASYSQLQLTHLFQVRLKQCKKECWSTQQVKED